MREIYITNPTLGLGWEVEWGGGMVADRASIAKPSELLIRNVVATVTS